MRKKWLLTILVLAGFVLPLAAQQRGNDLEVGAVEVADARTNVSRRGKQWAVFIAIDQYKEFGQLFYPVKDAKEIKKILVDNYYFDEVIELYDKNATAQAIRSLFNDLQKEVGANDSVFVFHAGHGTDGRETATPAWIAYDSVNNPLVKNGWLPHTEIRTRLDSLNAKHVFLISDSCYSGALLTVTRGKTSEIIMDYPVAYNNISRQVMSSGAIEEVADESEFASRLKSLLLNTKTPYITPLFLCSHIIEAKTKKDLLTYPDLAPFPQSRHVPGGNFLFFRKNPTIAQPPLETTSAPVLTEILPVIIQRPDPNGERLVLAAINMNENDLRQALRRGANVNYLFNERTALMEACNKNWLTGAKILLEEGKAEPDFVNAYQMSALMFAVRTNDNLEIARLLINRNTHTINARDAQRKTALMYAIENQNDKMVDFLIRAGANSRMTDIYNQDALIIAARDNYKFGVNRLLKSDSGSPNLSQSDDSGKTAFIYACEWENLELVKLLAQRGADVFKANADGLPPLLWLIQWKKSFAVIEYLVRNTQAIASWDSNSRDAFWYLEEYDRGNTRLRQLLKSR